MRRSGNFWPYGLPIPDHLVQMLNSTTFPVPQIWCGESVLNQDFSITQANGTYEEVTGTATFSITLPDAGVYLIQADIRGFIDVDANPPGWITAKLYNSTDAADIANSERLVVMAVA